MSIITSPATMIGFVVLVVVVVVAMIIAAVVLYMVYLWLMEVKVTRDEVLAAFPEDGWTVVFDLTDHLKAIHGLARWTIFGRQISYGQIYAHLHALELDGRVVSRWRDDLPEVLARRGGNRRREYRRAQLQSTLMDP